ncbi:hypothetical protein FF1_002378 [Malus domestica]
MRWLQILHHKQTHYPELGFCLVQFHLESSAMLFPGTGISGKCGGYRGKYSNQSMALTATPKLKFKKRRMQDIPDGQLTRRRDKHLFLEGT